MIEIVNQVIENREVQLDGSRLIDCVIRNCMIVYAGGEGAMIGCDIENCAYTFNGAAGRTLYLLRQMAHTSGDGTGRHVVLKALGLVA